MPNVRNKSRRPARHHEECHGRHRGTQDDRSLHDSAWWWRDCTCTALDMYPEWYQPILDCDDWDIFRSHPELFATIDYSQSFQAIGWQCLLSPTCSEYLSRSAVVCSGPPPAWNPNIMERPFTEAAVSRVYILVFLTEKQHPAVPDAPMPWPHPLCRL